MGFDGLEKLVWNVMRWRPEGSAWRVGRRQRPAVKDGQFGVPLPESIPGRNYYYN